MFQAAAVDGGQGPGAFTGGQQLLLGSAVMADTTHGVLWHGTEEEDDKGSTLISLFCCHHCVNMLIYTGAIWWWVLCVSIKPDAQ